MFKIVVTIRRKPGMTRQEFSTYYFEKHAPLARRVIPHYVAAGMNRWLAWYEGPEGKVLRDDEEDFGDRSNSGEVATPALMPGRDTLDGSSA
jgi:hypothetical protein